MAQRHRSNRQWGWNLGRHGGRAHPAGARAETPPDDPDRPLDRRGRRTARLACIRQAALRRSPPDPYQRQATDATSAASDGSGNGSSTSTKPSAESAPNSEYTNFSGYFNLDNGTGKIRGVYLQGNEAVRPIFRRWLQPFRDMGASTLTIADTGGTDHLSFDGIGLPGFQFIQDEIEYETRTHHSNQDVFDRIQAPI